MVFNRWPVTFGVRSGIGLQNGRARPRLPERTDPKIYFNIYGETRDSCWERGNVELCVMMWGNRPNYDVMQTSRDVLCDDVMLPKKKKNM